jgi:hypothetical protein
MTAKRRRPSLNTTIDPGLMKGLKKLAFEHGNLKYGQFVEEGIRYVLDKYGIEYQEERETEEY